MSSLPPLLRWAGGKRWLAPRIKEMYEPHRHRRLVEPFCGGLSIALELQPDRYLGNDINKHLINFYRRVRDDEFSFFGYNDEAYYCEARNRLNSLDPDSYITAQNFYYLNLAGFNGLCRYNRKGEFNVPYGKREKLAICEDFEPYRKQFRHWNFLNRDYLGIGVVYSDFLFVDSPYDDGFVGYSGNAFGWQQQIELADWLDRCPKVPQIATNKATDRIIELYQSRGWSIELVDAPRRISCNGDRNSVKEMLATRYF